MPELPREAPTRRREHLQDNFAYDALHDPGTGLYNESAYEVFMRDIDPQHSALVLLAIDGLELIRARCGRDVAARVIERMAEVLRGSFRAADYVCRIGKDEFAVIVTRIDSSKNSVLADKLARIREDLAAPVEGLPAFTFSAGTAFADAEHPREDMFRSADIALNRAKEEKRRLLE